VTIDLKTTLTITGLACDLIGAFLLSIHLFWNVQVFGHTALQWVVRGRNNVSDYLTEKGYLRRPHFILLIIDINILLALLGLFIRLYLEPGETLKDLPWWLPLLWAGPAAIIAFIFNLVLYWVLGLVLDFLFYAFGGGHNKVGMAGLFLLCVGFSLQAYINLLP